MEAEKKITLKSITQNVVKVLKIERYDPVELLPKNVLDQIFEDFSGKELMTMSLVNHKWYRYIGHSEKHMDKVEVQITEIKPIILEGSAKSKESEKSEQLKLFSTTDALYLTIHGRKYQHISLINMGYGFQSQHKLLLTHFHWQTVKLTDHKFEDEIYLNDFLGLIEPFVVELELQAISLDSPIFYTLDQNFSFPRLQKLSISSCVAFIYKEPFKRVTSLYSLYIGTEDAELYSAGRILATQRHQGIQKILTNNQYLDELELFLSQDDFDAIFMDERFLRNIRFFLRTLCVGCFVNMINEDSNIVQIQNFIRFLDSQKYSLLELNLEQWLGILVLKCAVNDLQLRGLNISTFEHFGQHYESTEGLALKSNQTIEHLRIWTENLHVLNKVIKVCPELKVLVVTFITQEIFNIICKNCPKLEVIICNSFTAFHPPTIEVLKNLRHMEIRVTCANNFRDLIAYRGCQNNFEEIFLKAAYKLQEEINWEICNNITRRHTF